MLAAFAHADFLAFLRNHEFDEFTCFFFLFAALHHKDRGPFSESGLPFWPDNRHNFKIVFAWVFIKQGNMVGTAEEHAALTGTEGWDNVGGGGVNRARLGHFFAHHGTHKGHRLSDFRRIKGSAEFTVIVFHEITARLPDKATHKPAGIAASG